MFAVGEGGVNCHSALGLWNGYKHCSIWIRGEGEGGRYRVMPMSRVK